MPPSFRLHRSLKQNIISLAAALLCSCSLAQAQSNEPQLITGQLENGTQFNIYVPSNWDGVLVLDADLPNNNSPTYRWMHQRGHATAGKSRNITDWKVAEGSADLIELKQIFVDRVAIPETTIVWGRSLGGLVTRDAIEAYPNSFDGAVPMCGGGAGMIGMWNNRLDAVFALKMMLAPENDTLELVNITNEPAAIAALRATVDLALTTPEGRARLALAAAIAQIDAWPTGAAAPPSRQDTETALQAIATAFRSMLFSRAAVERVASGNLSWNAGVSYSLLYLQASKNQQQLVRDLYSAAGRSYALDLLRLELKPRIKAKRDAVEWAIGNATHHGHFEVPVLSVFTAVDPRAASSELQAYDQTVKVAGNQRLLRQAVARVSGHCAFNATEEAAAIDAILERLTRKQWGSIGSAADLNTRGTLLMEASSGILTTPARFDKVDTQTRFPRPFIEGWHSIPRYAVE